MTTIVLVVVLVLFGGFIAGLYNGLIQLRNKTQEAWSDIDVQLKRRYDLVPNLVETVKGYARHEDKVFTEVTEARSRAMQAEDPKTRGEAEAGLSGALKSLFAVAESYPELKASTNFSQLQEQLSEIEDQIQNARRYYNGNVRELNTKIEVFPNNLLAPVMGFKKFEFFKLESEEEKKNVKVNFSQK
jgi:LemA protein